MDGHQWVHRDLRPSMSRFVAKIKAKPEVDPSTELIHGPAIHERMTQSHIEGELIAYLPDCSDQSRISLSLIEDVMRISSSTGLSFHLIGPSTMVSKKISPSCSGVTLVEK